MPLSKQEIFFRCEISDSRANASSDDIVKLALAAKKYNAVAANCNCIYTSLLRDELIIRNVKTSTNIGFPLGATCLKTKIQEIESAIYYGTDEINMMMCIGSIKSGDYDFVLREMCTAVDKCGESVKVKYIIETCYLSEDKMLKICDIARESGIEYLVTSSGHAREGAMVRDVALIAKALFGSNVKIMASGNIESASDAAAMIAAGASRLGITSFDKINDTYKDYLLEK